MDSAEVHDCCNDADTIAKTGKLCKADQDCQPVNPGMINLMECRASAPVGIEKASPPSTIVLSFEPSATWRPPTSV